MKLRKKSSSTQIIGDHKSGKFVLVGEYMGGTETQEFIIHGGERTRPDEADIALTRLVRYYGPGLCAIAINLSEEELGKLSNSATMQKKPEGSRESANDTAPKICDNVKLELSDIILRRAFEILRQFIECAVPPKVALSPEHKISHIEDLFGVSVSRPFGDNILYFSSKLDPNRSFCMVKADVEDYRDHYVNFINHEYRANFIEADIPKGLDIDHMLAKSNAPDSSWIRIEAVLGAVNRSHGGGVEQRNSASGVVARRKEEDYHHGSMTWLSAAKLAEIKSPLLGQSEKAAERRKLLVDYYVAVGFNRELVEAGIEASIHKQ